MLVKNLFKVSNIAKISDLFKISKITEIDDLPKVSNITKINDLFKVSKITKTNDLLKGSNIMINELVLVKTISMQTPPQGVLSLSRRCIDNSQRACSGWVLVKNTQTLK